MTEPTRRDFLRSGALAAGSMALFSACSPSPQDQATATASPTAPPASPTPTVTDSWAPAPLEVDGLSMVATQRGEDLLLSTLDGERTFWAGVGLSATLPGHAASEFAATAEDYERWFGMMRDVGVRVVRLDRLQAPELYAELRSHNERHPDTPLYILQGVSADALEGVAEGDPIGADVRAAMSSAINDTSAAVHGDLARPQDAPLPHGTWTSDVSDWVAGWIIGVPWNPTVVLATDRATPDAPSHQGTYFSSTADASATESWLAACMDQLAGLEAEAGRSAPIAVANWPTTDPLIHPEEPVERDDLVGVDVNHITVSPAWPGGTFAAYQAFPFTPHFLRRQPSYEGDDPYRSYLLDLRGHHRGLPLLVSEFGVPAALGRSHLGTNERHDGHLPEAEAMGMNADMLRMFRDIGCAGGLLVSWTDDWSATSPATERRYVEVAPERRLLWHDPLTSSQWHGLLAHDQATAGSSVVHEAPEAEMTRVTMDHDASYLYLTFFFTRRVTSPVDVGFDLLGEDGLRLPGGSGRPEYDVAIHLTPTMSTVTMYVRRTLDPVRLDDLPTIYLPRANSRGWVKQQLVVRPPLQSPGSPTTPAEMLRVGDLVLGTWNPQSPAFTSLATWQLVRPDPLRPMEWRLRLPWSMLLMADPSARTMVVPDLGEPTMVEVERMQVTIESSTPGSPASFEIELPTWDEVPETTERYRAGIRALTDAFTEVSSA